MLKIYRLNKKQNTFEVTLKFKGVGVHVSFVDGNTYNGTPAKCYTNDAFKQRAIEASQMFKDREITLERTVEDGSDRKATDTQAAAKVVAKPAQKPAPKAAGKISGKGKASDTSKAGKQVKQTPKHEQKPEPEKVFDNLGEAILYIAQNYDQDIQDEAEVLDFLKANGVNAVIKKG
jgi:hypothetical protein